MLGDYAMCRASLIIIIHAAAVKHVPICQYNPQEVIKPIYLVQVIYVRLLLKTK